MADEVLDEAILGDGPMWGIGWIVLRGRDRNALAAFYAALGFEEYGRGDDIIGMHIGNGAILEIGHLPNTTPDNLPSERQKDVHALAIIGCADSNAVAERARAAGARWTSSIKIRTTDLWYVADPEGNVIGFANGGPAFPGPSRQSLVDRLTRSRAGEPYTVGG